MLNGPSYALTSAESFLEANDTDFIPGTGTRREWRKEDGCSLDQGRDKNETEGRKGSNTGPQNRVEGSQTVGRLTKQTQIT